MAVSYQEFSKRIKTKYPVYVDMDDLELSRKIISKYPQYKDEVSFDVDTTTATALPTLTDRVTTSLSQFGQEFKKPFSFKQLKETAETPILPLSKRFEGIEPELLTESKALRAGFGVGKAAAELTESLTTPENIIIMATIHKLPYATVRRVVSGGFGVLIGAQAPKHYQDFKEAYGKGNVSEAARNLTLAFGTGGLAVLGFKEGLARAPTPGIRGRPPTLEERQGFTKQAIGELAPPVPAERQLGFEPRAGVEGVISPPVVGEGFTMTAEGLARAKEIVGAPAVKPTELPLDFTKTPTITARPPQIAPVEAKPQGTPIVPSEAGKPSLLTEKQPYEMTRKEYDIMRAKNLGLKIVDSINYPEIGGFGYAYREGKISKGREGNVPEGFFTHELRHAIDDKLKIREKIDPDPKEWMAYGTDWMALEKYFSQRKDLGARTEGIITKEEITESVIDAVLRNDKDFQIKFPEVFKRVNSPELQAFSIINKSHKSIVLQAISEGKPVPPEVLKDYPELLKEKPVIEKPSEVSPEIKISEVFQKSDRALITKQGSYTNGKWLIFKEFITDGIAKRFEKKGIEDKRPDESQIMPKGKEQDLKLEKLIVGDRFSYYLAKAEDGTTVGVDRYFYDYFNKHIPNFKLKAAKENPASTPMTIYSGNKKAGVVMTTRTETKSGDKVIDIAKKRLPSEAGAVLNPVAMYDLTLKAAKESKTYQEFRQKIADNPDWQDTVKYYNINLRQAFEESKKEKAQEKISLPVLEKQETSIQKVVNALKEAKPIRKKQELLYAQERGERLARAISVGEKVKGEKGYYAELGQLKGELPKATFESIREKVSQKDIDNLFVKVKDSNLLSEWEKFSAREGLAKILGVRGGGVPQEGELKLLDKVFPKEMIDVLMEKRPLLEKMADIGYQLANIPRSLMSSFDLSAPFRQGIFLISKPKQFFPAFGKMFRYFGSEKAFTELQNEISARPTYELMKDNKLALTETSRFLNSGEERFMSNWAEKIPVLGIGVRASGRAYSGFLNKLRADVFDDLFNRAKDLGLKPKDNPVLTKDLANFVNNATGRGSIGSLERSAVALNSFFFSPRLIASRLNLLNPVYYVKLEPFVRKEALKTLFSTSGTLLSILGLAKMGGAKVEDDPRNADFAKIKIGNTRVDPMGGFQQYIRLASQLISGKIISSTTGKVMTLGEGYRPLTRVDILGRAVEYKEAPVFSFATSLLRGKDVFGEKFDVKSEIGKRFVPMVAQDIYELSKDNPKLLPLSILGVLGAGLQTYGGIEGVSKDVEKELLAHGLSGFRAGEIPIAEYKAEDVPEKLREEFDQLYRRIAGERLSKAINLESYKNLSKTVRDKSKTEKERIFVFDKQTNFLEKHKKIAKESALNEIAVKRGVKRMKKEKSNELPLPVLSDENE